MGEIIRKGTPEWVALVTKMITGGVIDLKKPPKGIRVKKGK